MPRARPISAGVDPSRCCAYSANTGNIMNRPSIRVEKIAASDRVARRSFAVMLCSVTGLSRFCLGLRRAGIVAGCTCLRKSDGQHSHSRRPHSQSAEHRPRSTARQTDRHHWPVRLRQVLARLRHDLCGGPTPLRRIAVALRAPDFVNDGKDGRRSYRRPVAGNFDRTKLHHAQSALAGELCSPVHSTVLESQTVSQMVDQILALPVVTKLMLLAPVVQERKGEHHKLLEELRAQGYVRARIDGEVAELDAPPKLDLRKKHSIEVVIDRFKVRADVQQRLADSIETALKMSDGVVRVAFIDAPERDELLFSAKFACPICGYSLTGLAPRLFSFNNPAGACPTCAGLGVKQFFDPARVIVDATLSVAGGAIRGWDRRTVYYFHMLQSLARHYGFDIDTPFEKLPRAIQQRILYGSDDEEIEFVYLNERGDKTRRSHPFEGIIPNIERRYRETESNVVREELAKYLSHQPCPSCAGTRLRIEARNVFLADRNLPAVTNMSIERAHQFFDTLVLPGRRGEIAVKILKEVCERLNFLINVGLDYLTLDRSADTLSGGEAQRIRLASQIGAGLVGVMYVLDEPSIGLHQRDNDRLIATLRHLRDIGNIVIVVEHDEDMILAADHVLDMGPGAGVRGGRLVAQGSA